MTLSMILSFALHRAQFSTLDFRFGKSIAGLLSLWIGKVVYTGGLFTPAQMAASVSS